MRYQALFTCLSTCLFLTLITGLSVAFGSETEELKALQSRFLHTVTKGFDACPVHADPSVREYIFVFEGGMGYDAYNRAYWMKEPHSLKSVRDYFWESGDLEVEIRSYEKQLTEAPRGWSDEKFKVYGDLYRFIHRSRGNSALITGLTTTMRELENPVPKKILYFPWNGWVNAVQCAERLDQMHEDSASPARISSIGFSLGGYSTILFARELKRSGLQLKNILTLDPVPFTFEIYKALRRQENTTVIPAPDNHDRWMNLYQSEDRGAMKTKLGNIPIRGSKVSGTVENQIPVEKGLPVSAHMALPGCDVSRGEIARLLVDNDYK